MYNLSILLPSKYPNKLKSILDNLKETMLNYDETEIVICLDAQDESEIGQIQRSNNIVVTWAKPSKYRGTFFNACWRASTGRFLLMANDDILFKTPLWDSLIPYNDYPDDIVLFYFRDNQFNERFACHPLWSRKVMEINPDLFEPLYQITKCDNTIWDIYPSSRRVYLDNIVIEHKQTPYGPEWLPAYAEDNKTYFENTDARNAVKTELLIKLGLANSKVMIGLTTAEYARRADFYDNFNMIDRPIGSIYTAVHGQAIANNRNLIVEQALAYGCTHVFFIDDDVITSPGIIYQLLESNKDVVTGLQLKRNFPHLPLIYGKEAPKEEDGYLHYQMHELTETLMPIKAAGLGCILIKTDVFRKLEKPYFRHGELKKDQLQEDTGFFKRINALGIESFCNTRASVGHISSAIVKPIKREKNWMVDYNTNGSGSVSFIPAVIKT